MALDRRSFLSKTAATVGGASLSVHQLGECAGPAVKAGDVFRDPGIWDLHCHLSRVPGSTPIDRAKQLLTYADRMGIQRLVFFMGMPYSRDPKPDDFRRQNDQVIEVIRRFPHRILGFAYVNGNYPSESVREIDRCVSRGPMVGIKLWIARRCSDKALDPIIRRCGELNAAIYQHTWLKTQGNDPGESTPMELALLASRHPSVPIICGHTGGNWQKGIRAVRAQENVSIGIGGSEPTAGFIEMAVRELGAQRVIYGSDIGGRSFASQLAKVLGAEVPAEAKRAILGANLRKMLLPILQAKGIEA